MGIAVGDKVVVNKGNRYYAGVEGTVLNTDNSEYIKIKVTDPVRDMTSVGENLTFPVRFLDKMPEPTFADVKEGMTIRSKITDENYEEIRQGIAYELTGGVWRNKGGYELVTLGDYVSLEILDEGPKFDAAEYSVGDVIEYSIQGFTRRAIKMGASNWSIIILHSGVPCNFVNDNTLNSYIKGDEDTVKDIVRAEK